MIHKRKCRKCGSKQHGGAITAQSWDYGFCSKCFNQMPMNEIINYSEGQLGVTERELQVDDYVIRKQWNPVDLYWHELTLRYLKEHDWELS